MGVRRHPPLAPVVLLWVIAAVVAVLMAGGASADSARVWAGPPDTSHPAAKPADPDGELPAWPFAVGAIAAVAVVAIWSVRRRP